MRLARCGPGPFGNSSTLAPVTPAIPSPRTWLPGPPWYEKATCDLILPAPRWHDSDMVGLGHMEKNWNSWFYFLMLRPLTPVPPLFFSLSPFLYPLFSIISSFPVEFPHKTLSMWLTKALNDIVPRHLIHFSRFSGGRTVVTSVEQRKGGKWSDISMHLTSDSVRVWPGLETSQRSLHGHWWGSQQGTTHPLRWWNYNRKTSPWKIPAYLLTGVPRSSVVLVRVCTPLSINTEVPQKQTT